MNLLLLSPDEIQSGIARVVGRRARHIAEVIGAQPGQVLRAGIERGPLCTAEVVDVSREVATLRVEVDGAPVTEPSVDLVLAMPRPKVLSRALQTAASLGVRRVDVVNAWRVDKSYFGSKRLSADALGEDLRLGCEQGCTTWVPDIEVHRLLVPFLDRVDVSGRRGLLAHPRSDINIESALPPGDQTPVTLAIGPDGGWIEKELETFDELGFAAVSISSSVLRVEAAVAALLSEVALLRRLGK